MAAHEAAARALFDDSRPICCVCGMTAFRSFLCAGRIGVAGKPHYSGYAGAERHCGVQERRQGVEFPNGSRLKFGYCRNDSDLLQYQGQAYDVIFLEEYAFPENVFTTMTESNRSSGQMPEFFPLENVPDLQPGRRWSCLVQAVVLLTAIISSRNEQRTTRSFRPRSMTIRGLSKRP